MKNLIALLFLVLLSHDSCWGQQTNDLIKYRAGNRLYIKYANWLNPEADSNYAKMGVVSVRQSHYEQNPAKSRKKHLLTRETWFDSLGKETRLIIYNKKD